MASAPRSIRLDRDFLEDLRYWVATDRKIALHVIDLVVAVIRDPFQGIGKPEPLKRFGSDVWSRRVNQSDRIVYVVRENEVEFLQARYHYKR